MNTMHQSISNMCSKLGEDRLLVQGAGGNVSWKENGTLWIKGSGAWLANANTEDIFVPVNLKHLQDALAKKDFDVKPQSIGEYALRPSIETNLHALMQHKIVVHLHAINALSYLVTQDSVNSIQKICGQANLQATYISYHKPGPELAQAIYNSLQARPDVNIVFLQSHGIVIGANSIEEVYSLLQLINISCIPKAIPAQKLYQSLPTPISMKDEYIPFVNNEVQGLAFNSQLFKRLHQDWVLYPDHVVFLGPKAHIYQSWEDFQKNGAVERPEIIFIKNAGVYVKPDFNKAKVAQLVCYFDLISRVSPEAQLSPLCDNAIYELLNWDAEKLRQQMAHQKNLH